MDRKSKTRIVLLATIASAVYFSCTGVWWPPPFRRLMKVTSTCHPEHVTYLAFDPDDRSPLYSIYKDDPDRPVSEKITLSLSENSRDDYFLILPGGERCRPNVPLIKEDYSECDVTDSKSESCIAYFTSDGLLPPSIEPYEGQAPSTMTKSEFDRHMEEDRPEKESLNLSR